MRKQIKELLKEQRDHSSLIEKMKTAKTEAELLHIARKLIVRDEEYDWLEAKIDDLFEKNA
ncbi:MAG: hypothetical protein FJ045_04780 [Crenarchaeota archaeon]|nr:hypothetical protein [Thermoproteota archaeon]